MKTDTRLLQDAILQFIEQKEEKITQGDIEKIMSCRFSISRKDIRNAIKTFIANGYLAYTNLYGHTFIETAFNRAVRISERVILKPAGMFYECKHDDIVVEIIAGSSFGDGRHPTTRLAIRGIEYALNMPGFLKDNAGNKINEHWCLDIGTGSGVLAITALKMGICRSIAIDTDSCARFESKKNALINHLEDRIEISDTPLKMICQKFKLITANLRYPTLMEIYSDIRSYAGDQSALVISGIRPDEVSEVVSCYTQQFSFWTKAYDK